MPPQAQETVSPSAELTQNATAPPPHKKYSVVKILAWIFGVLIGVPAVIIIIPNILGLVYHDSAPENYPGLTLSAVSIPNTQNAYFDMLRAGAQVNIISSATSTATQKSSAKDKLYSLFASAAQKRAYQDPVTENPNTVNMNTHLPPLNDFRSAAIINNAHAIQLAQNGKTAQALKQALATVFVGNKMTNSQGDLIEYLVGADIEKRGLSTLRTIASATTSPKALTETAAALSGKSDNGSGLVKALKLEWYTQKSTLNSVTPSGIIDVINLIYIKQGVLSTTTGRALSVAVTVAPSFYWQPNKSIGYDAKETQKNVYDINTSCATTSQHVVEPVRTGPTNYLVAYFTPNLIGKIQYDTISKSFYDFHKTDTGIRYIPCNVRTLLGATQLTLALHAYQRVHRALPDSLNELVPVYLPTMPLDPYSGKTFRYDHSNGGVYSAWENNQNPISLFK